MKILNKYGLHARPAMKFVEVANQFSSKIEVSNGVLTVDAKSIMSVMRLAGVQGTVLGIVADGHDAKAAVAALAKLVEDYFGIDELKEEAKFLSIEPSPRRPSREGGKGGGP